MGCAIVYIRKHPYNKYLSAQANAKNENSFHIHMCDSSAATCIVRRLLHSYARARATQQHRKQSSISSLYVCCASHIIYKIYSMAWGRYKLQCECTIALVMQYLLSHIYIQKYIVVYIYIYTHI